MEERCTVCSGKHRDLLFRCCWGQLIWPNSTLYMEPARSATCLLWLGGEPVRTVERDKTIIHENARLEKKISSLEVLHQDLRQDNIL